MTFYNKNPKNNFVKGSNDCSIRRDVKGNKEPECFNSDSEKSEICTNCHLLEYCTTYDPVVKIPECIGTNLFNTKDECKNCEVYRDCKIENKRRSNFMSEHECNCGGTCEEPCDNCVGENLEGFEEFCGGYAYLYAGCKESDWDHIDCITCYKESNIIEVSLLDTDPDKDPSDDEPNWTDENI